MKQYLVITDDMGGDYTIYVVPQDVWDKIKGYPQEDFNSCDYCEFVLNMLLNIDGKSDYPNHFSQTLVLEDKNIPETHGFTMIHTF